ncbi:MAG: MarR family transcriptional regulator [Bryobacterales bacterium]|nr:MarR family transcriptional regulator [Acidobacteriota bacterium]MCB9385864.1 MarR family transcriptional regulator [Bryobacterales bacterium]
MAKTLQEEIRQSKPFGSKREEALLGLMRTADLMRRVNNGLLEPFGVTVQQYNVLRILRGAGKDGLPTLEIADRMIEQTPGITRLLDRIEAKGWVKRARCPKDRRQMLCTITPEGLALLERTDEPISALGEKALGSLSDNQVRTLIRLLDNVRQNQGENHDGLETT